MLILSRERRKYLRIEKIKQDFGQSCFGSDGKIKVRKQTLIKSGCLDINRIVFCPFCLKSGKAQKFLVSGKKGISHSKALCPFCNTGMLLRTVLRKWTPENYASWVFAYSRNGFWQKIVFEEWKIGLNLKKWTIPFWNRYNALKGSGGKIEELDGFSEKDAAAQYDEITRNNEW